MERAGLRLHTRIYSTLSVTIIAVAIVCLLAAVTVARPDAALAASVARGIADPSITAMSPADQGTALNEIKHQLRASYVRFFVSWAQVEPTAPVAGQPVYDPTSPYMTSLATAIDQAVNHDHLRVILTFQDVPQWASDPQLWAQSGPVAGYQPFDAMSTTGPTPGVPGFKQFCQTIAAQFQGLVYGYEVWNEPNLYLSLYPQTTPGDSNFAAHLYIKMLTACSQGIRAGASATPSAPRYIIAGATAPRGMSRPNIYSTSPQRFAAVIKAAGPKVLALFDDYSHHPYTPGATPVSHLAPAALPANPGTTVSLENLGVLLKMFPTKHFFLTEYGYQTAACQSFAGQHVSQITQAEYLEQAYAYVARYRQVKMLLWFLLKDDAAGYASGFYTGLETGDGVPKRSWYAFAGGNALTLSSPTAISHGATLTLTGRLASSATANPLADQLVVVQSHAPGLPWATIKTVTTGAAGDYGFTLRPKASAYYRVAWLGVITSRTRHVTVR